MFHDLICNLYKMDFFKYWFHVELYLFEDIIRTAFFYNLFIQLHLVILVYFLF